MIAPINYVDLYDRLYPEQQLTGLASENQITVQNLNSRYGVIRNNQRSLMMGLNGIVAALPDGAFIRDFMVPFHEIAAAKRFIYSEAQIDANTFRNGFDAAGQNLNFQNAMVIFPLNNLGSSLDSENTLVMVFSAGLLINPIRTSIRSVQGGLMVYVQKGESWVTPNEPVDIVVMRKFGQLGITHTDRFVTTNSGGDVSSFSFVIPNRDQYNLVHSTRLVRVMKQGMNDSYYRPISRRSITVRPDESGDALLIDIHDGAKEGDAFTVFDASEFWEHHFSATDPTIPGQRYYADLILPSTYTVGNVQYVLEGSNVPAPVWYGQDVDVYKNGVALRFGYDYWINWNYHRPSAPPQLVVRGVKESGLQRIDMYSTAAHCPQDENYFNFERLIDEQGVINQRSNPINTYLPNIGIVKSNGKVHSFGTGIETIAGNRGLFIHDLKNGTDFEFRARFVMTDDGRDVAIAAASAKTPLDQLVELVGTDLGGVDPIGNFKQVHNPSTIPDFTPWNRQFLVSDPGVPDYAFTEPGIDPLVDELGGVRSTSYDGLTFAWFILQGMTQIDNAIDCRDGAEFAEESAPPGVHDNWNLDCRPGTYDTLVGFPDIPVDCRDDPSMIQWALPPNTPLPVPGFPSY
jgi:hypothetical protein